MTKVLQWIMYEKIEHIAYEGAHFTVEWYFDKRGRSQSLHYYQALSDDDRMKILRLFKRMGDAGEIKDKTKFVNEHDKIYAFKPQPDRFLCFFYENQKIIVTNAFRKKQQKLPSSEKEVALKMRTDYMLRVVRGDYYG